MSIRSMLSVLLGSSWQHQAGLGMVQYALFVVPVAVVMILRLVLVAGQVSSVIAQIGDAT